MDQMENRNIAVGGLHFRNLDDLENFCAYFPEFEDAVIESGVLSKLDRMNEVDTYLIAAELEYGDGNAELPWQLHCGWYGDVLLEK